VRVAAEADFAADPMTVARMMADEGYVRAKVEASGATADVCEVVGDADGTFTVTTRRGVATDTVPPQFRSFVGESLEVRAIEAWEAAAPDGSRAGTILVEVTGAPVRLTGTVRLTGDAMSSHLAIEGDLKASIPIFGSAVEQAIAQAMTDIISAEKAAGQAWLAHRPG
jgi:hypothetical protein